MPAKRPLNIFISYASQDVLIVRKLYAALQKETWLNVWFDKEELLPGMDWDLEIYKALRKADVILPCFSAESVAKEGYVQKEFKRALDYAEEKPDGTIYVIPLRLDDCTPPRKFHQWQWLDYFQADAHIRLLKSLFLRAKSLERMLPAQATKPALAKTVDVASPVAERPALVVRKTERDHSVYSFGGLEFVKVAAGDFFMGANDIEGAKPEHLVYQLDYDFYMARFPVTNRQYALMAREKGLPIIMSRGQDQHPVVNLSWNDVQVYISWLNNRYSRDLPQGHQFRLPSEAEWEKAARGADGNIYPWGDQFDAKKCNGAASGIGATTPVGEYSPQGDSPYGCADMAGNVWEWTRSISDDKFKYPYRFDDGREDEQANSARVLRGGAFSYLQDYLRCAYRLGNYPDGRHYDYGFRIVVSPSSS